MGDSLSHLDDLLSTSNIANQIHGFTIDYEQ